MRILDTYIPRDGAFMTFKISKELNSKEIFSYLEHHPTILSTFFYFLNPKSILQEFNYPNFESTSIYFKNAM